MLWDREKYGPTQQGTHQGIRWKAILCEMPPHSPRSDPRNTVANTGYYWCGYVCFDERDVTARDVQCMDRHEECTYDKAREIGFDYGHHGDYPADASSTGTFKDFAHVKRQLMAIIDDIVKPDEGK